MYQLNYYQLADSINVEDVNITDTTFDVKNLDTNTDYVFQIKAYTSRGAGPWSNRLQYRTFGKRMSGYKLGMMILVIETPYPWFEKCNTDNLTQLTLLMHPII